MMQSIIAQQELQNQKLRNSISIKKSGGDMSQLENIMDVGASQLGTLKSKLPAGGVRLKDDEPFPEDFVFRQNEFRCEDLEVEERALMNISAQEYDNLRLIAKLPVKSELYRFKMD